MLFPTRQLVLISWGKPSYTWVMSLNLTISYTVSIGGRYIDCLCTLDLLAGNFHTWTVLIILMYAGVPRVQESLWLLSLFKNIHCDLYNSFVLSIKITMHMKYISLEAINFLELLNAQLDMLYLASQRSIVAKLWMLSSGFEAKTFYTMLNAL